MTHSRWRESLTGWVGFDGLHLNVCLCEKNWGWRKYYSRKPLHISLRLESWRRPRANSCAWPRSLRLPFFSLRFPVQDEVQVGNTTVYIPNFKLKVFRLQRPDFSPSNVCQVNYNTSFMAVRKSPDGWVLFVFRWTKVCLGEAQALLGGSGGMLPRKIFGKMEPNPATLCILAVKTEWLQHGPLTKSTQKLKKKISFGWADLVPAREGSSEPPEPPLGTGLSFISPRRANS